MRYFAVVFLLVVLFVTVSSCRKEQYLARAGHYVNTGADATYIGKEACKSCHPGNHMVYIRSEMGRSFRAATLANSNAEWDNVKPIYDQQTNLYYLPFHRGQELFVMEYRVEGGDTTHKRIEKIDYIVGSGQHTNSHMRNVNGYVYQIPVTYYTQDRHWGLAPGFQHGNSRFNRVIELECMTCHNAPPTFVPGSENRFTHVPEGISCENCHGPGSIHQAEMQAQRTVDITKEIDYTIVNPRKLSPELNYDICRRCHMQGAATLQPGKSFLDFRPSQKLGTVTNVYWPRFADSTNYFIMASHPDRLEMSACFKETWKQDSKFPKMTCISCHYPHVSVREQGSGWFNNKCKTCHTPQSQLQCTEKPEVRAKNGDNCAACHMPVSASADIPYIRITDHYIRKNTKDAVTDWAQFRPEEHFNKKFYGMRPLIKSDPDARDHAKGYLTYYERYRQLPYLLDSAEALIARAEKNRTRADLAEVLVTDWFMRQDYNSIAQYAREMGAGAFGDAWTQYRVGESFLNTRELQEAILYFEAAVAQGPDHLRFRNKLGEAYAMAGQVDQALATFNDILKDNPTFEEALNNRGFTRIRMQQFDAAEKDFKQALALSPDFELALANLASLYYNTGRAAQARPLAARLIRINPSNAGYRQLWDAVK